MYKNDVRSAFLLEQILFCWSVQFIVLQMNKAFIFKLGNPFFNLVIIFNVVI